MVTVIDLERCETRIQLRTVVGEACEERSYVMDKGLSYSSLADGVWGTIDNLITLQQTPYIMKRVEDLFAMMLILTAADERAKVITGVW